LNTVWYSVICPASGTLAITTAAGTLTDTQIQLWQGACAALTPVAGGCNDNATTCSGFVYYSSVTVSGLTAGATYYVSVDGYYNMTGSFSLTINDGSTVIPTTQDCNGSIPVCSSVINQPQSFFGCGSVNDIPPIGTTGNPNVNPASTNSGCMFSGELHTVWYTITIGSKSRLDVHADFHRLLRLEPVSTHHQYLQRYCERNRTACTLQLELHIGESNRYADHRKSTRGFFSLQFRNTVSRNGRTGV
jgi:hypothetical protein